MRISTTMPHPSPGQNPAERASKTLIFSAASDSFNLLVRALKTQGRLEILSRPQVTTTDGQQAQVVVGQFVPYVTGASIDVAGGAGRYL